MSVLGIGWQSMVRAERTYQCVVGGSCPLRRESKTATRQLVMTGRHAPLSKYVETKASPTSLSFEATHRTHSVGFVE